MFPTPQRLYIAFGRGLYNMRTHGPEQAYLEFYDTILPLTDEFARQYAPESLQLDVGVPTSVFYASWWAGLTSKKRVQAPNWKHRM